MECSEDSMKFTTNGWKDFLDSMEYIVGEEYQVPTLYVVLNSTHTHWWDQYKDNLISCDVV